jgi:hypothetical protein
MPVYQNPEQLYLNMQQLFDQLASKDGSAAEAVANSRLMIRLHTYAPEAEILINGRKNPVDITYGASKLRPDLDFLLSADALHYILLGELSLKRALTSGQLKVRGPAFKSFVLEGIFRQGQELYPQIWQSNT